MNEKEQKNKTAEEIIAELDLDERYFPHLSKWKDKEHLLRTLQGIAKSQRMQSGDSGSQSGAGLKYDLSKSYSNEEIHQIVSSVTDMIFIPSSC
jgi:hypothetical protein